MSIAVESARPGTPGSGRAKAVALLIAAVVVALGLLAAIWWWASTASREVSASWSRLQMVRQTGGVGPGASGAGSGFLLVSGGSSGAATAELQRLVGAMARASGASVRSTQAASPRDKGEVTEVGLNASLLADTTQLRGLLHAIETGTPLMIVDEISVRALPPVTASMAQPMPLEVELKLRAFAVGAASARKEAAP